MKDLAAQMKSIVPVLPLTLLAAVQIGCAAEETNTVTQVLDGDTFQLADGRHVRHLGINAPETGDPQAEAATQLHNQLLGGKTVRLETGRPARDRDGRLLAYVFVDKMLVNAELVRQGCAHVSRPVGSKYKAQLLQAQDEARAARRGIWNKAGDVNLAIAEVHPRPVRGEVPNLNNEYVVLENRGDRELNLTGWTISDEANRRYLFPNFTLPAKGKVTLRTGLGANSQTELFWGSRGPIWNDTGDTIFLRDASGHLVLVHLY